jgi:gamma-glutamyltranspeptidase/glutathione hydrolase
VIRVLVSLVCCLVSFTASANFLPPIKADGGMVVTDQRLASQVGADILKAGGNAIDAAVAVGYALAVVDPCCGNIGGGGFMIIHLAKKNKDIGLNFRERAPGYIRPDLFVDPQGKLIDKKLNGYLYIGVPGTVLGLNTALKRFGMMPLKQVMNPAIGYAQNGFRLTKYDVSYYQFIKDAVARQPNVAKIFSKYPDNFHANENFKQPELAHTLTLIRDQGSRVFYNGEIAQKIVADSQKNGGVLSLRDFRQYRVKDMKPIHCNYRGYEVVTLPPPSSGVTICETLRLVNAYPLSKLGYHSALTTHYNAEAMRYAFLDRNEYLGDPRFVENPTSWLLSKTHLDSLHKKIHPYKASRNPDSSYLEPSLFHHTTHYVISDKWGNIVSVTYTLNSFFGAKIIAGDTGFFLNNELDDFSIRKGSPNQFGLKQGMANIVEPNKQPLSSMSPTLVKKGSQYIMTLGAAGGSTIITSIIETIENIVDFDMGINGAVNRARYHMQAFPDVLYMEPFSFSKDTLDILHKMGYKTQLGSAFGSMTWGQMAAILFDPAAASAPLVMNGENDNRRPGGAAIGVVINSKAIPIAKEVTRQ